MAKMTTEMNVVKTIKTCGYMTLSEFKRDLVGYMENLNDRDKKIIKMRFAIDPYDKFYSYNEIVDAILGHGEKTKKQCQAIKYIVKKSCDTLSRYT